MPPVRAFLAIPLPSKVIAEAAKICRRLDEQLRGIRWVRPENMHLTLRFFGDVDEETLDEIEEVMLSVGRLHGPCQASVEGAGAFPSAVRARVFWLGIKDDESGSLRALHANLEKGLEKIGFPAEDRPFTPHLTLGRARHRLPPARDILEPLSDHSCGELTVDRLVLFESRLQPTGAVYLPLKTVALGAEN